MKLQDSDNKNSKHIVVEEKTLSIPNKVKMKVLFFEQKQIRQ